MKKKILNQKVSELNAETAAAIKTIVGAISSQGQVKKLLKDEKVVALLKKHNITL